MTVNDVAHSFVEMAKAYEQLPGLERELESTKASLEEHRLTIQRLEGKLLDRGNEIDTLHQLNHKLEAERDDAELRFLELEEQSGKLASLVKAAATHLGMVDKPEPAMVAQPETLTGSENWGLEDNPHEPMPVVGQSEDHPTPTDASSYSSSTMDFAQSALPPATVEHGSIEEASASATPDPTAPSTAGDGPSSADAPSVSGGESASTSGGRYAGRMWSTLTHAENDEFWAEVDALRQKGQRIG